MTYKCLKAPKSIGRQLNFSAGAGNAVCNALLEPHGLTLAQWVVLQSLWINGALNIQDIAELTGNAAPATSRIVDRMVTAGLLAREHDEKDRRAVIVRLTEKSENMRGLSSVFEKVNGVLLESLTDDEIRQLFHLLKKAEDNARDWLAKRK